MNPYWTDLVRRLTPYVPGAQRTGASVVKLNTNENPYPPAPAVLHAIASVDGDALRRYPDPNALELREALASYHQLQAEQVFVGNGSDEILALAFMAFFSHARPLQYPEISYSFYPVYCDLFGIESATVPLDEQFQLDLSRFEQARDRNGGIVFPNPNAPTARAVSLADIETLLKRCVDAVVLVDEAYADFGAESAMSLIDRYPNLLVCRTFSKGRSLAGMRLGSAFGHVELITAMQRVKDSFNSYPVDAIAQRAGIASLQDETYYRNTIRSIVDTRQRVTDALLERQFRVLPSTANFVFASPPGGRAHDLFRHLDQQDILLRHWNRPPINQWLRISIGTDADMDLMLAAVDDFLQSVVDSSDSLE